MHASVFWAICASPVAASHSLFLSTQACRPRPSRDMVSCRLLTSCARHARYPSFAFGMRSRVLGLPRTTCDPRHLLYTATVLYCTNCFTKLFSCFQGRSHEVHLRPQIRLQRAHADLRCTHAMAPERGRLQATPCSGPVTVGWCYLYRPLLAAGWAFCGSQVQQRCKCVSEEGRPTTRA
jgi:hypothetical protein